MRRASLPAVRRAGRARELHREFPPGDVALSRQRRPLRAAAGESVHERRRVPRRKGGNRRQSIEARRLRGVQGVGGQYRRAVGLSTGLQSGGRLVSDRPARWHLRADMRTQWRRRIREIAGRPPRHSADTSLMTAILTLSAGALLTVTTGLWIMLELEQFGPAVGGIIVFRSDSAASERWTVRAAIAEPSDSGIARQGERCVLSPVVMAGRGGSLV